MYVCNINITKAKGLVSLLFNTGVFDTKDEVVYTHTLVSISSMI